ncbi:uncharacterized protein N0V89_002001 [Didymosphaeria variabile]|uniref:Uncharacterized protein n=1 Tax=Didymosphaeria variabile TaxID=1932322 RepID=A0A9W9CD56_9PLEO|nr:uncharacterized protein N0V89_002001 [Didymosphaeria variabile]KAJ4357426.1 hypothetical protein N0V89_002001 [Didymosphaeria variabile]
MKDKSKEITRHQKKALVESHDDHARPSRGFQVASPSKMDLRLETRCEGIEDDIQVIIQNYAPINSNIPAESNSHHNQICGAWVEVLPLLSVGIRNRQFLFSAIKTLATALRHHKLGNKLSQPQIFEMYSDSLRLMGKALEEARGAFLIEHSAAILCLAVTDRRKTFLAREEWTTTPFRGQPSSMIQLLFNKASKLPALLERYYDMVDLEDISNIAAVERLRKDFQNILKSFREWEITLHSEATSPRFWSKPNPGHSPSLNVDVLWFPNIMTANSLTHCWAFEIIARRHRSMLGGAISTAKG